MKKAGLFPSRPPAEWRKELGSVNAPAAQFCTLKGCTVWPSSISNIVGTNVNSYIKTTPLNAVRAQPTCILHFCGERLECSESFTVARRQLCKIPLARQVKHAKRIHTVAQYIPYLYIPYLSVSCKLVLPPRRSCVVFWTFLIFMID